MLSKLKTLIKKNSKPSKNFVVKQVFTAKFDDLDMQFTISLN